MLTIRAVQWQVMAQAGLIRFEHEMVRHLSDYAPELAKVMGEERMHALVKLGMERGRDYGFTDRGPLRSYLEMMLALGSDFDTDPVLARATAALRGEPTEPHQRAAALYEGVLDYCRRVNGLQNEHALGAMKRIRDLPYESLPGGGNVAERALVLFRSGFPQKYDYAGEATLRALLAASARISVNYGILSEAGKLLIASLMYGFGHGVFGDPAYRWVPDALSDTALADPEERARHLHRKARLYVTAAVKHFGS